MSSTYRQVLILAAAQALFQTASVLVMTVGGLAGSQVASRPDLATIPIASMFLGTAITTFPASAFMARTGRRAGFVLGASLGITGGAAAALGIWLRVLPLLALGTMLVGSYQAFAQFYRFAASEVADDRFRSRAISLVLGGGIVAALLGPFLGRLGGGGLEPAYVGSFLILALVSGIAAGILSLLDISRAQAATGATSAGRPLRSIVSQPGYLVALFGAATGYGVMILGMTATPLAMAYHHHELSTTAMVIQFHVVGMFLPSFFTGSLIERYGVLRIMLTGVMLLGAYVLITWMGTGSVPFATALALLGTGWNFLYTGGTTLLTTTYSAAEKSRAQATNDMTLFAVGLTCSFLAGWLMQTVDWRTLNALLLPWLAAAALALSWFGVKTRAGFQTGRFNDPVANQQ
jgi:MFS family permease